ncbi:MAG: phosphoenolpyruvate hydrolase family protein [Hyphomicrobiales bacterium]
MQISFVEQIPDERAAGARGSRLTIVCPWLKGLPPRSGLWISALPIHDVNDFVDSSADFSAPQEMQRSLYFGLFALDRFRSAERLLSLLRDKGVERIINLPSVSFFDGWSASILESLDLGYAQEVAFLHDAKRQGFHVGLCARRSALSKIENIEMFDIVLCHDGPKSEFSLWKSGATPA